MLRALQLSLALMLALTATAVGQARGYVGTGVEVCAGLSVIVRPAVPGAPDRRMVCPDAGPLLLAAADVPPPALPARAPPWRAAEPAAALVLPAPLAVPLPLARGPPGRA